MTLPSSATRNWAPLATAKASNLGSTTSRGKPVPMAASAVVQAPPRTPSNLSNAWSVVDRPFNARHRLGHSTAWAVAHGAIAPSSTANANPPSAKRAIDTHHHLALLLQTAPDRIDTRDLRARGTPVERDECGSDEGGPCGSTLPTDLPSPVAPSVARKNEPTSVDAMAPALLALAPKSNRATDAASPQHRFG